MCGVSKMYTWKTGQWTLYKGQSWRIQYWWGDDHGPSFAEIKEFTGSTRGNKLVVTAYGTIRNTDNTVTYFIDIKNEGPQVATFELIGVAF